MINVPLFLGFGCLFGFLLLLISSVDSTKSSVASLSILLTGPVFIILSALIQVTGP